MDRATANFVLDISNILLFVGVQGWKSLPAYCVGQATANFVRDNLGLNPVGEQSGNAQNLVQIILQGKVHLLKL